MIHSLTHYLLTYLLTYLYEPEQPILEVLHFTCICSTTVVVLGFNIKFVYKPFGIYFRHKI